MHPVSGPVIEDGVVLVRDGRIEEVGPAEEISVPAGYRVVEGAVVTPGLIDAHSVVGLAGIYNQPSDQNQLETSDPIQPELRAIDAYNAREPLVRWLRDFGITTLHTGHGPGALISGQTMVVKTHGETVGEALVDSVTMVAMTLGPDVSRNFSGIGTRSRGIAALRAELLKAQQYREKGAGGENGATDLGMELLGRVLEGRIPALITAHTVPEILESNNTATAGSFAIGTLLGILLAVGIVHARSLEKSLLPWIISSQTVPILAIAPMIVVVLGAIGLKGLIPKAVISMYLCFFPVAIGMVKGLRSPDLLQMDLMRTYSASRWQTFWMLRWPSSLPFLFASLKVAIAISLVGAIVAELPTGAQAGLGARMLAGSYYGQTIQIWSALVAASVLAASLVGLVALGERWAHRRMGAQP